MADDLTFVSPPRISVGQFERVLRTAHSPAAPKAAALYQICVESKIDPAVALAFFGHESSYGTRGLCATHKLFNWGNVRTPFNAQAGHILQIEGRGGFAVYPGWKTGLLDWCKRMVYRYGEQQGLRTVRQALPIYAPASDHNDPVAYADAVVALVARWQREDTQPSQRVPPSLATLTIRDIRDQLPWATDDRPRPAQREGSPTFLTDHYNGPPVPPAEQRWPGLLARLIADAHWQMRPAALSAARGGDGLQYHYVIDADGLIYLARDPNLTAWHCGNETGNTQSLAIHFPIGGLQDVTEVQWQAACQLHVALIAEYAMAGRQAVKGHLEWSSTLCPGPHIMQHLTQWRDQTTSDGAGIYTIRSDIAAANVREGPGRSFPVALAGKAIMWPGDALDADGITQGEIIGGDSRWYHRRDGLGFVHASLVKTLENTMRDLQW